MKRSEAARYARWSAVVALLLVMVTGSVYLRRMWGQYRDRKNAPADPPANVDRQSSGITFSKVDGNLIIFTVQASKSINFKGKDDSSLEDVRITIFGKRGVRHDVLHTQSCLYSNEKISCSGIVQIEIQSAAEAARAATPSMTVETRGVSFDRASGFAQTNQPVKFSFPSGRGQAVGVEYRSDEGTFRLLRDIRMDITQPSKALSKAENGATGINEVHVTGSSMVFDREARTMKLAGPAQAETTSQKLTGGEMLLSLSDAFRAQKLVVTAGNASDRPRLVSERGKSVSAELAADKLTAEFASEGWVAHVDASGQVNGSLQTDGASDHFSSEAANVEMWPRVGEPKIIELTGNVDLKTAAAVGGDARTLKTNALRVAFSGAGGGTSNHPVKAETLSAASIEWTASANGANSRTKLQGDKLALNFDVHGKATQLIAAGNVLTERAMPGKPAQSARATNGVAQLTPGGGWNQMELRGSVRLNEGDRTAKAEQAVFDRSEQTATLTGNASFGDGATETHASRIVFLQSSGEITCEGGVRSTDFSAKGNPRQAAAVPMNLSSEVMRANTKIGRVNYTGHARMWQGQTVVEADTIELVKETKEVHANGNVRGVFAQASRKGPVLWHASAGAMTYNDAQGRAYLEQNTSVQSADQRIRANAMDLFFAKANGPKGVATSQQIERAVGTGGVIVEQGGRRGTGERGEYTAAEGKFTLSGGSPTLFDSVNGTTTGHELTFFFADDTIIVDSENGLRTVTKHRVER